MRIHVYLYISIYGYVICNIYIYIYTYFYVMYRNSTDPGTVHIMWRKSFHIDDLLHQKSQGSLKVVQKWTLVSSGRIRSNHQMIFDINILIYIYTKKIYIYTYIHIFFYIPFTSEFNHLNWLPDDLVHQVPNATDVSWNEEFEFPVTPVKSSVNVKRNWGESWNSYPPEN